jgi:N-acetylneuraminic acid mutarotase
VGNKLYIIGGTDGKKLYNDVFVFDIDAKAWSQCQTTGGIPQVSGASSYVHDGKVVFFGGDTYNGLSNLCFALDTGL